MSEMNKRSLTVFQLLTIFAFSFAIRLIVFWQTGYTYEDSHITYRYAENLAEGNGFVYNEGERVLGTTTPLYTLLLAIATSLGIPISWSGFLIPALAASVTPVIAALLLQGVLARIWIWLVAILLALSPADIQWSITGMETGLVTGLGWLAFYLYEKQRYHSLAICSALLILLRVDAVMLVGILGLFYIFRERSIPQKPLIIFLLMIVPWVTFSVYYFGSFVPNSVFAKKVAYIGHASSVEPNLLLIAKLFFWQAGPISAGVAFFSLLGMIRIFWDKSLRFLIPIVSWFLLYYLAYILSKTHIHPWYVVPPLGVWLICYVIGFSWCIQSLIVWCKRFFNREYIKILIDQFIPILATACIAVGMVIPLKTTYQRICDEQIFEDTIRKSIGLWLRSNTAPDASVFLEPIGYIGYYSQRYILDDVGLVSPELIPFNIETASPQRFRRKILTFMPDYVVVRKRRFDYFDQDSALNSKYQFVRSWVYSEISSQPNTYYRPKDHDLYVFSKID